MCPQGLCDNKWNPLCMGIVCMRNLRQHRYSEKHLTVTTIIPSQFIRQTLVQDVKSRNYSTGNCDKIL